MSDNELPKNKASAIAKMTERAKALKGSTLAADTQSFVDAANAQVNALIALYQEKKAGKPDWDSFFNALAAQLSKENAKRGNGGPFGAVIVEFENSKPVVRGIGANHVFPNSDPSAHAEMEAYRDFARRTGKSDLEGATLYTSCECCPMCLGIANGAGVSRISYSNTRVQADQIAGFTDKAQYDLLASPFFDQMTHTDAKDVNYRLEAGRKAELIKQLGNHGAMVLDGKGEVVAFGDADTIHDPTHLASIQAIRNACAKQAQEKGEIGQFALPDDYSLVTRKIPHVSGLITADWSKILRKRDPNDPFNPDKDAKTITPGKLIYLEPEFEEVWVTKDKAGPARKPQETADAYKQPALPDEERMVPTSRYKGQLTSDERMTAIYNEEVRLKTGEDGYTLMQEEWKRMGGEPTHDPRNPDDATISASAAQQVFEMWAHKFKKSVVSETDSGKKVGRY